MSVTFRHVMVESIGSASTMVIQLSYGLLKATSFEVAGSSMSRCLL